MRPASVLAKGPGMAGLSLFRCDLHGPVAAGYQAVIVLPSVASRDVTRVPAQARMRPIAPGKPKPESEVLNACARPGKRLPGETESAFGADLAARRPANPITLCDDRGIDFVTVAGHIPMAVRNLAWRARKRSCYGRTARARIAAWAMRAAVTSSLSEPADTGEGTGNGYRSVAARGGAA